MVTSKFAALDETVQYGVKVYTPGEKWEKRENSFGDNKNIELYLTGIKASPKVFKEQMIWARNTYNWSKISSEWLSVI